MKRLPGRRPIEAYTTRGFLIGETGATVKTQGVRAAEGARTGALAPPPDVALMDVKGDALGRAQHLSASAGLGGIEAGRIERRNYR